MLTEATTASGMRRAISESGRYRWRARVRDEAQLAELERLRKALDRQAGYAQEERRAELALGGGSAVGRAGSCRSPGAGPGARSRLPSLPVVPVPHQLDRPPDGLRGAAGP